MGRPVRSCLASPICAPSAARPVSPCSGVRVHVADPKAARPYALGVALLRALRTQPGFEWRDKGTVLDQRVGTRKLREALERGDSVDAIVKADAAAIDAFRERRKPALLY